MSHKMTVSNNESCQQTDSPIVLRAGGTLALTEDSIGFNRVMPEDTCINGGIAWRFQQKTLCRLLLAYC